MCKPLLSLVLLVPIVVMPTMMLQAQTKTGPETVSGREVTNGIKVPKAGTSTGPIEAGDTPISKRSVKFGVGLGVSSYLKDVYSYALIAPNYTLSKEKVSPIAGVFSGVVIFNKSIYYYKGKDVDTEPYARTYPLSALLAVNLATFAASATSTAAGFNTRLDLGVGIGYRFDDNFQIGLMLDFASMRFLREAYQRYEDNPIPAYATTVTTPATTNGPATTSVQNLTALDSNDDHYFISHTVPSISLKFIYNLTPEQPSPKAKNETNQFLAQ
jgi:hypothetical protein